MSTPSAADDPTTESPAEHSLPSYGYRPEPADPEPEPGWTQSADSTPADVEPADLPSADGSTAEGTLILDQPTSVIEPAGVPIEPTDVPIETSAKTAVRGRARMRTVVFGLVLLVIAGSVLVGQLTDVTVDATAVFLALMIGGGVLLIAGARRS